MPTLGTTRFNNSTWRENCAWRQLHGHAGCAYGVMKTITDAIPLNTRVFVLEMNNDTDTIMGIGLISNVADPSTNTRIYRDQNYCCFTYKGAHRIDAAELTGREKIIVKIFEHLVFKNKTHLKRSQGITAIPKAMIEHVRSKGMDLPTEVEMMFSGRFRRSSRDNE